MFPFLESFGFEIQVQKMFSFFGVNFFPKLFFWYSRFFEYDSLSRYNLFIKFQSSRVNLERVMIIKTVNLHYFHLSLFQ